MKTEGVVAMTGWIGSEQVLQYEFGDFGRMKLLKLLPSRIF